MKTQCPPVICGSSSGVPGVPGVPGLNGREGALQQDHLVIRELWVPWGLKVNRARKALEETKAGPPGKMGPKGREGPKGAQGTKGEQGAQAMQKNRKQCAWTDHGLIKVITIDLNLL